MPRLNFLGPVGLKSWLQYDPAGQSVLHDLTTEMCEGCRYDKQPVLLVLHPDGAVELHAARRMDLRVINAWETRTVAEEIRQTNYIYRQLPKSHREIYKGTLAGYVGRCVPRTIDDEIRTLQARVLLRDVEAWRRKYRDQFGEEAIDLIARDVRVTCIG